MSELIPLKELTDEFEADPETKAMMDEERKIIQEIGFEAWAAQHGIECLDISVREEPARVGCWEE